MNYFDFIDRKTAPRPSHMRLPPSKAARAEPVPREAKAEPIEVAESEASESMILRVFKFWQR